MNQLFQKIEAAAVKRGLMTQLQFAARPAEVSKFTAAKPGYTIPKLQ